MTKSLALVASVLILFVGCARLDSIYRRPSLDNNHSVVTDAKQRIVTNIKVDPNETVFGRINPQRVVCAEPSPDVAQAISQSVSGAIQAAINQGTASGQGSANFAQASAESVIQLGERLATIQLLRDKFYRACEAYANGAMSATGYTIMLSRLDKVMATMLLAEMAAGAFGRNLAAAGGSAQAGATPASNDVQQAQKAVDDAQTDVTSQAQKVADAKTKANDANTALRDDPNNQTKQSAAQTAQNDLIAQQQTLHDKQQVLLNAQQNLLQKATFALAMATPSAAIGSIVKTTFPDAGTSIVQLQRQYLDSGDFSTVLDACVTSTDMLQVPTAELFQQYSSVKRDITNLERSLLKGVPNTSDAAALQEKRQRAEELAARFPLSPLGYQCRELFNVNGNYNLIKFLDEQRQDHANTATKADNVALEKARIELCQAAVTSSNDGLKKAGQDCLATLSKNWAPSTTK
jgi:hypothetical protein